MLWLSSPPSLRKSRTVLVATIVGLLLFWHLSSSPGSAPKSRLQFKPSSFDWSTQRQFFPPPNIKPLPTEKPHKLPQVQANNGKFKHTSATKSRQKAVRDEFLRSYKSYKQYAWMKDELMPISIKGKDNFGGWAATLVDSLDTLWIMGLKAEFSEAAQAAATLNWGETHEGAVNLFETTIRHLGGLLGAYELSGEEVILKKAIELGEMLYVAFDTPNRLPGFWLNFEDARNGKQIAGIHDPSASPSSLVMEFTRLSQITGDPKFYDATDRVTQFLIKTQNHTLLPGMWPLCLDFQNEQVHDNTFSLGALADSLYEYLPKMHALLGGVDENYQVMYRTAMDVVIKNLLYRPMLPEKNDILFSGDVRVNDNKIELSTESQHLTCFTGGMFALGGKLLEIEEYVNIGERLARGCGWAYKAFPTGMMPEIFDLARCPTLEPCTFEHDRWKPQRKSIPPGFQHARDPRYLLRPEAIESIFIMYRITADPQWQDMAWDMFQAIVRYTSTEHANAGIADVVDPETVKIDSMESFWLSETLKYFYLIFSPPDLVNLDEYVLNTEAHPFRRP
ncbi:Ff.00g034130.m01.CDS01 [Fusarium sp. VM40]|nr:Ff.00g034130.m01.CDS01 [Fusarium sp. VM40]